METPRQEAEMNPQNITKGDTVRDRNSADNLWGRVTSDQDAEQFVVFTPINGSEAYMVWVGCLSKNAYR